MQAPRTLLADQALQPLLPGRKLSCHVSLSHLSRLCLLFQGIQWNLLSLTSTVIVFQAQNVFRVDMPTSAKGASFSSAAFRPLTPASEPNLANMRSTGVRRSHSFDSSKREQQGLFGMSGQHQIEKFEHA